MNKRLLTVALTAMLFAPNLPASDFQWEKTEHINGFDHWNVTDSTDSYKDFADCVTVTQEGPRPAYAKDHAPNVIIFYFHNVCEHSMRVTVDAVSTTRGKCSSIYVWVNPGETAVDNVWIFEKGAGVRTSWCTDLAGIRVKDDLWRVLDKNLIRGYEDCELAGFGTGWGEVLPGC